MKKEKMEKKGLYKLFLIPRSIIQAIVQKLYGWKEEETSIKLILMKAEYISVNEEGFVNEQVNDGVYKLYSDEAAFIKDVIGFDNSGYKGVIEVVNQRILDAQDCGEEILNKVFAVRIIDIPDSEDKREEIN
ncbi:hypothetical protein DRN97_02155 [Methanosarcinales archaeon]|nr:MAG: hypothetical protein DRN97_02155 [Methanosarcinales archaeon]